MRTATVALSLVFAAALTAVGAQQDGQRQLFPPGPRPKDACDIKKIEQVPFCNTCQGVLDEAGIQQHKTDKEYKSHDLGKTKACIREYHHCETHPENDSFDKGQCCGKDMEKKIWKARVNWVCETCGTVQQDDKKCQREDCPKSKMRTECTASPNFPHTNEKLWRENKKKEKK